MIIGMSITEDIIRQDPRYVKKDKIELSDISTYTIERKFIKDAEALQKVNATKAEYGNGVSALVRIYNACGESISLIDQHDWHGHIWKYPYDQLIQNGQWSVFLHVHSGGAMVGACGAVVYRASKANQDIFLGWESPYSGSNCVYVESRETGHWPGQGSWSYMQKQIEKAGTTKSEKWNKLEVNGLIGQSSSPVVDFVITHP